MPGPAAGRRSGGSRGTRNVRARRARSRREADPSGPITKLTVHNADSKLQLHEFETAKEMLMIRSFRGCATVALLCLALTAGACGKKKIDTPAPANTPPPAPAPEPTKPAPPPAPAPAPAPAPRPPTEDEIFAKWTL